MGLKFIGQTDLEAFLNAVQTDQGLEEFAIDHTGVATDEGMANSVYIDQLDKVIVTAINGSGHAQRFGMPPLLLGTSFPNAFYEGNADFTKRWPLIPGDPFRPGGQFMYASESGTFGPSEWELVFPITALTNSGVGAFPTVPAANGPIRVTLGKGAAIPPGPGTWNAGSLGPVRGYGFNMLVFEGLTDGISGETNLVGTGVYPKGLGLFRARLATCPAPIGTGGANDCDNALVWLDLNTGLVDGRMPTTPGLVAGSGANSEAPIAGQEFHWQVKQYIPDIDATFAIPKGELLLVSDLDGIPADPLNFPESVFLKIIDFNPFGVSPSGGAPPRTHERIRLQSSCDFNTNPMFDVAGAGAAQIDNLSLHFHPPSLRFFMVLSVTAPTVPNVADEAFIGYWLRAIDPAIVTSPVAIDVARTNDVVEFESFVTGILAEPVAGAEVDWTLERVSTVNEPLDTTFPGSTNVANPPIDQGLTLALEGTLVIEADGTPLVRGVDYNVVLASGLVSWITDQSGATTVVAKYEHRETPVTPPHGTLLTNLSVSEQDGRVTTQVLYPDDDDLVGQLDQLTSALAP